MRLPRLHFVRIALIAAGAVSTLCARPLVVATNTILADVTREIAGDGIDVRCLAAVGTDLHGFEPKAADVASLSQAALVVANGAGFEPWLAKLVTGAGYKGTIVEAISGVALIEREHDHAHDDGHNHEECTVDPHAWQAPANGALYAATIRDALIAIDPPRGALYQRRARLYIAQLETLDGWARRLFALVPPDRRVIVTSHDALAYFGAAYDIAIIPVRGLDTRQEPDARQIAALVDTLNSRKARALFVESVSNPKTLELLARDTGATIGGELFTDSVSAPGTPAGTYLGLLRENTLAIIDALGRP